MIEFVSDLRQVGGFLRVFQFPPQIKLKKMLKVALNTITLTLIIRHLRIYIKEKYHNISIKKNINDEYSSTKFRERPFKIKVRVGRG